MKSREEAAEYLNSGECYIEGERRNSGGWRFGRPAVRALMDFIYEGEPQTKAENILRLEKEYSDE